MATISALHPGTHTFPIQLRKQYGNYIAGGGGARLPPASTSRTSRRLRVRSCARSRAPMLLM